VPRPDVVLIGLNQKVHAIRQLESHSAIVPRFALLFARDFSQVIKKTFLPHKSMVPTQQLAIPIHPTIFSNRFTLKMMHSYYISSHWYIEEFAPRTFTEIRLQLKRCSKWVRSRPYIKLFKNKYFSRSNETFDQSLDLHLKNETIHTARVSIKSEIYIAVFLKGTDTEYVFFWGGTFF